MNRAARSPGRRIAVCICTFRRPQVVETLASIDVCAAPDDCGVEIVVVDNDTQPTARQAVERFSATARHPVRYIHRPGSNISLARNAALAAAGEADIVVFADDDERAAEGWLVALVDRLDATGADVVLGPVDGIYGRDAPRWMRRARVHDTRPVQVGETIRTGYTCNVAMRMNAAAIAGRRFSVARGRSGGEDTAFFHEAWSDGARIAFAPDARMEEDVPAARAAFGWLARRRFRSGQTHGTLLRAGRGTPGRLVAGGVALAKCGACAAMSGLTLPVPSRAAVFALRSVLHAGVVAALLGLKEVEIYGAGPSDASSPTIRSGR